MADELFQLSNGRYITSEEISRKMFYIKSVHPELPYQENSTGYSWDEAGMADLFSECYAQDTRFCPEAKSWYTYDSGKWQKDVGALLVSAKIKEFVRLMALYCGEIADEEKRKQYMAFVAKMGDRRFRDRLMKDYSHGMKNKMQMLINMIAEPDILLLDEPLTSLDVVVAEEMKQLLRSHKDGRITIFSTHIMDLALDLCDVIVLLSNGELEIVDKENMDEKEFKSKIITALKEEGAADEK